MAKADPEFGLGGSAEDWKADDFVESNATSNSDDEYSSHTEGIISSPLKPRKRFLVGRLRKKRHAVPETDSSLPENQDVIMPSTLGINRCESVGVHSLANSELRLREGQANDALTNIRLIIGELSFLYREKLRQSTAKTGKTKAWKAIQAASRNLRHHQWIYGKSRDAMLSLTTEPNGLAKYQVLRESDVGVITTIVQSNAPGQRDKPLSWIWRTDTTERDDRDVTREGTQIA